MADFVAKAVGQTGRSRPAADHRTAFPANSGESPGCRRRGCYSPARLPLSSRTRREAGDPLVWGESSPGMPVGVAPLFGASPSANPVSRRRGPPMSDHEARARAVYDHDEDEPRPSVRRRRQVADWGVGEEIFDHMPGRRFERRPAGHGEPADAARRRRRRPPHDRDRADARAPARGAARATPPARSSPAARTRCAPTRCTRSCGRATSRSPSPRRRRPPASSPRAPRRSTRRTAAPRSTRPARRSPPAADAVVRGGAGRPPHRQDRRAPG